MWIQAIFLATLVVLGNTFVLDDLDNLPSSLDTLLKELKVRDARNEQDDLNMQCEGKPADIAFIIDASRSIYPPHFYQGMEFIQSFVKNFEIGPDDVRIAAVTFGKYVIPGSAFGFDAHETKDEVLEALKSIKFISALGDGTNTAMAIAYARKQFFVNARPNVKKIVIVLTDGNSGSLSKTKAEAELLKSQDVQIIAIGVGYRLNPDELKAIASDEESFFQVSSYADLSNIITNLGFITCKLITTAAPPTTIPTTTTTTTTTTTPPPKAEPCDGQAIDFNFVFDPAQMGTGGTENAIRFIKTVVSAGDLDNGKVRVGTVTGPCPETKGFRLNRYKTLPQIQTHFDEYRKTDIASLVTDLRMEAFAPKNGGRAIARKVGVLFLKGKLSDPEKAVLEAKLAKENGVEIFIVNMGSLNHESVLESMASGKSSHILRASDSGEMVEMAREMVAQICKRKSQPEPNC